MLHMPAAGLLSYAPPEIATPGVLGPQNFSIIGGNGVKSAWLQLAAANTIPFDVCALWIGMTNTSISSANATGFYDIGIGAAGSEVVIASNIACGSNSSPSTSPYLFLPLFIPRGSRVSVRWQASGTGRTARPMVWFFGSKGSPSWPVYQRAETFNANTATSTATTFTLGVSGAEGTWADLPATTKEYGAVIPVFQMNNDGGAAPAATYYAHIDIGISSTQISGPWWLSVNTLRSVQGLGPSFPIYGPFPSGTVFQVRGENSSTTAYVLQCGLTGFY